MGGDQVVGPGEGANQVESKYRVKRASTIIRWWFGITYVLAGAGCIVSAPIWIAQGNGGGAYLLGGGLVLVGAGWLIHPWGLARYRGRVRSKG
jgi:hypothetical protein